MLLGRKRVAETSLTTWIAIGAVIIIVLSIGGYISLPKASVTNVSTSLLSGQQAVTKPVQITCNDALTATNCGAVTVTVFQGSSNLVLDTLTATASGVATSGNSYQTGTAVTIEVSGNSKTTEFLPATIPGGYVTDSYIFFSIYATTLGSWTITNGGSPGGTTFTSGNTYLLTAFSGNSVTITTNLGTATTNTGYKSSYDIQNLLNQYLVVQVDDGAGASSSTQYATVTGFPHTTKSGSTNYYFVICPDGLSGSGYGQGSGGFTVISGSQSAGTADSQCTGSLSQKSQGNTNYGGAASFQWTLGVGSLTTGNTQTFQIKVYKYADPAYFAANGNLGPNMAQVGSTFTIKVLK